MSNPNLPKSGFCPCCERLSCECASRWGRATYVCPNVAAHGEPVKTLQVTDEMVNRALAEFMHGLDEDTIGVDHEWMRRVLVAALSTWTATPQDRGAAD